MRKYITVIVFGLSVLQVFSLNTWISHPSGDPGLYFFRKTFDMVKVPESFPIDITADSKFLLYVNNQYVTQGPECSGQRQWNYQTVDIAPLLKKGKNIIAVEVLKWDNYYLLATQRPVSLMVRGRTQAASKINTRIGANWQTLRSLSHHSKFPENGYSLFLTPNDSINTFQYPWDWKTVDYLAEDWHTPVFGGEVSFDMHSISYWSIKKESTQNYKRDTLRFQSIIAHSTEEAFPEGFIKDKRSVTIKSNSNIELILYSDDLILGQVFLELSRGKSAEISLEYATALRNAANKKLNRNILQGEVHGSKDIFVIDGGLNREINTTTDRLCRFVKLKIKTGEEDLELHQLYLLSTNTNPANEATFKSSDESLSKIWKAGANTVKLLSQDLAYSSVENERVQFLPEAWAIGLSRCYYFGNDIPLRNSIDQFYQSLMPDGLVNACAPCNNNWLIPHYSLYYIMMLYDYYQYTGDIVYVTSRLNAVTSILKWYEEKITTRDVVSVSQYDKNVYHRANNKYMNYGSAFNTILYVYALQLAGELYESCGVKEVPLKYQYLAEKLRRGVIRENYSKSTLFFTEEKGGNAQLMITNIFALLAQIVEVEDQKDLILKIISSDEMIGLTHFERFFLGRLLSSVHDSEIYQTQILPWHNMILDGLTTLGDEFYKGNGTDVYGGGVTPCLNLIGLTAGISPYEAGYKKVLIAPEPGDLESFELNCFLPKGPLKVSYHKNPTGEQNFEFELPKGVTGYFKWKNKLTPLKSGSNKIQK